MRSFGIFFFIAAVIIYDHLTGKAKGFGFVTFVDAVGAANALISPLKKIDGKMCEASYVTAEKEFGHIIGGSANTQPAPNPNPPNSNHGNFTRSNHQLSGNGPGSRNNFEIRSLAGNTSQFTPNNNASVTITQKASMPPLNRSFKDTRTSSNYSNQGFGDISNFDYLPQLDLHSMHLSYPHQVSGNFFGAENRSYSPQINQFQLQLATQQYPRAQMIDTGYGQSNLASQQLYGSSDLAHPKGMQSNFYQNPSFAPLHEKLQGYRVSDTTSQSRSNLFNERNLSFASQQRNTQKQERTPLPQYSNGSLSESADVRTEVTSVEEITNGLTRF